MINMLKIIMEKLEHVRRVSKEVEILRKNVKMLRKLKLYLEYKKVEVEQ